MTDRTMPDVQTENLLLERLEAAANAKDGFAFNEIVDETNWDEQPPEVFAQAVHLAFPAGAYAAARRLAMEGAERYPEHAELQKMAYILAPPKVRVVKDSKPNTTWKNDRKWLMENWGKYRGKWVALYDGELLGVADNLEALIEQVGDTKGTDILVTPIW